MEAPANTSLLASKFSWTIDNFSKLNTKKLYSDIFVINGYKWRLLMFPKGNHVNFLSVYLDVADSTSLSQGWSISADYGLSVVNQRNRWYTVRKDTKHQFNARESDWGFTSFISLGELRDPGKGFLLNDTLIVEAEVSFSEAIQAEVTVPKVGEGQECSGTTQNHLAVDLLSSTFAWTIRNFSRLNIKKHYSESFQVGGYKWRVLIYPKGNNVDYLSMYLDVAHAPDLPCGWSTNAQFSLSVVNQVYSKYTVQYDTQHTFNAQESDWGFTSFMPLNKLCDPSRGFLVGDTLIVGAEVDVTKVVEAQGGTVVIQPNKEGVPEAGPSKSATQQGRLSSCAICLDAPIEGACIPCGHMPGCMSCLSNIEVNSWGCPICRAKIQKVVRIYTV